jgi:hypothetical protein
MPHARLVSPLLAIRPEDPPQPGVVELFRRGEAFSATWPTFSQTSCSSWSLKFGDRPFSDFARGAKITEFRTPSVMSGHVTSVRRSVGRDSAASRRKQPMPTMTTPIPSNLLTPDSVDTRLGTLRFFDGFPDQSTVEKVYDNLDFIRGVEVFLNTQAAPSLLMNFEGMRSIGVDGQTIGIFENLVDSKTLALTPNTQTVSMSGNIDLKNGPIVVEIPPNVLGLADDAWMRFIVDMGLAGPDKGKGGKFLFVPPSYDGEIPAGYYIAKSRTYAVWLAIRGFTVEGDPRPAIADFKKYLRVYPLSEKDWPPETKFVNMSGKPMNSIQASDFDFFVQLNRVVQSEPAEAVDPETAGLMAAIGIVNGKPFEPDARMKRF